MRVIAPSGTPAELEAIGFGPATWDSPAHLPRGQRTFSERMPSAVLEADGEPIPWPQGRSLDVDSLTAMDPLVGRERRLGDVLDDRLRSEGLMVVKDGQVIAERYALGLGPRDIHVVHSCSKTLTTMAVAFAFDEGRMAPDDAFTELIPELADLPAWRGVTLEHVLDMASGLRLDEHYDDPSSMYWRYATAVGYYGTPPSDGSVLGFAVDALVERQTAPGTRFNYGSYLTNLIAIAVGRAYDTHPAAVIEDRIYRRLGCDDDALVNLDPQGNCIAEGQVSLTLGDFARWAHLYANGGRGLDGQQVLPRAWVDEAFEPDAARRAAFAASEYSDVFPGAEYHRQAWLLQPGHLAMLGIHGQFAYVVPAERLLIVGLSSFPDQVSPLMAATLRTVWSTIANAA